MTSFKAGDTKLQKVTWLFPNEGVIGRLIAKSIAKNVKLVISALIGINYKFNKTYSRGSEIYDFEIFCDNVCETGLNRLKCVRAEPIDTGCVRVIHP